MRSHPFPKQRRNSSSGERVGQSVAWHCLSVYDKWDVHYWAETVAWSHDPASSRRRSCTQTHKQIIFSPRCEWKMAYAMPTFHEMISDLGSGCQACSHQHSSYSSYELFCVLHVADCTSNSQINQTQELALNLHLKWWHRSVWCSAKHQRNLNSSHIK